MLLATRQQLLDRIKTGTLPFKVGNAAGTCKTLEDVRMLARMLETGSVVTVGSYRFYRNDGNGGKTEGYDGVTGTGINFKGIPTATNFNEFCADILPLMVEVAHDHGHTLVVSVHSGTLSQIVTMAQMALDAGADQVEINAACPNDRDPDARMLCYNLQAMTELSELLHLAGIPKLRIRIKLGNYSDPVVRRQMAQSLTRMYPCIVLLNTYPDGILLDGNCQSYIQAGDDEQHFSGGISGTPLNPIMQGHLYLFGQYARPDTKLVAVGGIASLTSVLHALALGASEVQMATALYWDVRREAPFRIREDLAHQLA